MPRNRLAGIALVIFVLALSRSVIADDTALGSPKAEPDSSSNRWLLLCCGLAGDDPHHERLTDACKKIAENSGPKLGVQPQRLRVLAADERMRVTLQAIKIEAEHCTKKNIQLGMQWLAKNAGPRDETWVILLGHAHLYGNRSQFNIQDRDIDQMEFAELANDLTQQRQVFVLTMPVSGFWIKPLAKPNRVIMTATEPGLEFTGTEMPYVLADVLAGEGEHPNVADIDADGTVSLLDLYLAINLEVAAIFRSMDRLQTEHAQLDDNGDGKGTEVQSAYLPIVSDEDKSVTKPDFPKPISVESLDGFAARHILLQAK